MEDYERLEHEFATWAGVENVVACSSGTAALHLALEALQLPKASSVVLSDYNMIACPRAIAMAGHRPVFVDCDDELLLGTTAMHAVRCVSAGAVMATHIYGRRCKMDALVNRYGVYVIEDLAEAHGVQPHPFTDAACWSFYKNKIVYGEEGGAVAFRDPEHAALARQLRSLGFTAEHDYNHIPRGHNYRMSNLHAKVILQSLDCAADFIAQRRLIEAWYNAICPKEWRMPARDAVWVYDIRIPGMTPQTQTAVVSKLRMSGIQARHGFKPMHIQEEFDESSALRFPNAMKYASEILYLPVQPYFTTQESCVRAFSIIDATLPR